MVFLKLFSSIKRHPFIWILIILSIVLFCSSIFSGRFTMSDLFVDYSAARNLLRGEQVYQQSYGFENSPYKYSPFTLFLLAPLALLPYSLAKVCYFFTTVGLLIYVTLFLERFLTEQFFADKKPLPCHKILFLATLIVAVHYERELHLGNHNILLLTALLISLNLLLKQKNLLAGVLLGQVILMKPHFLVLLPLLLLRKQFKALLSVIACLGFGFILPAFVLGWEKNVTLHWGWLQALLEHNSHLHLSPNTLQTWLYKSVIRFIYPDAGIGYNLIVILFVAGLFFLFVMYHYLKENQIPDPERKELFTRHFIIEYLLLIALVPDIVETDTEHFLWSLSIIMFILSYLMYEHRRWDLSVLCSMIAFSLYGGDWYELWGKELSTWIQYTGFLGLGNMFLLLITVYILDQHTKAVKREA